VAYIIGTAVLGIANTIIGRSWRSSRPRILITLGLFYLVINIAMVRWPVDRAQLLGGRLRSYVGVIFIVWIVNWARYSLIDHLEADASR
jgi:uncharacterized membrane protein YvlD (DUF360 family)